MDILTHTLSGIAVGSCVALFSKKGWVDKSKILFFSGLGGALPDIDAISLWSKFDGTFGKWLALSHPGKEIYSGKFWYSHHGFMHSLAAAVTFAFIVGLFLFLLSQITDRKQLRLKESLINNHLPLLGFILGYVFHLFEDMVTPSGSWGGVRLFFPSGKYIGGTGDIWWWNNYDIFLIVITILIINLLLLLLSSIIKKPFTKTGITIFAVGCILVLIQIKTRGFNFNGKSYELCENKSKQIQKELLNKKIYRAIEKFDRSLKIYF